MSDKVEVLYKGNNGSFQGLFENGQMTSPMVSMNFDKVLDLVKAMQSGGKEIFKNNNHFILTLKDKRLLAVRFEGEDILTLITEKNYLKLEPVRDKIMELLRRINFKDSDQVSKTIKFISDLLKSDLREFFKQ